MKSKMSDFPELSKIYMSFTDTEREPGNFAELEQNENALYKYMNAHIHDQNVLDEIDFMLGKYSDLCMEQGFIFGYQKCMKIIEECNS